MNEIEPETNSVSNTDFDSYKQLKIESLDAGIINVTDIDLNGLRIIFTDGEFGVRGADFSLT